MRRFFTCMLSAAALTAGLGLGFQCAPAKAEDRPVQVAGFGAMSGVVRVFGIGSEAAMKAAAEKINAAGGIKLGDGTTGK